MAKKQNISGAEQSKSCVKAEDNPGAREEQVPSPRPPESRNMRSHRNHVCRTHETTAAVVKPSRRACSSRYAHHVVSIPGCTWCAASAGQDKSTTSCLPPISTSGSKTTILTRASPVSKDRTSRRVGRGLSRVPRLRKPPKSTTSGVDIFEIQSDSSSDEQVLAQPFASDESIDQEDGDSQGHERHLDQTNNSTPAQHRSEQGSARRSPSLSFGEGTPVSSSNSASMSESLSPPEMDYVFVNHVTDATLTCEEINIFKLENPEKISLRRLEKMFECLEASSERRH
jgi:hypothetical protein